MKDYISFSSVLQGRNNFFDILKFFAKWKKVPVLSQVSSSGLKKNIKNHNGIWDLYKYKEREIEKFRKKYPILCNYVFPESTYNVCSWWKNGLDGGGTLYELIYTNNFKFPGRSCFLFSNKVFVTYNGELLICEKTSRKYLFGKISNKKISIYVKRINRYYDDIVNTFNTHCLSCCKNSSCSVCFFNEYENIANGKCFCNEKKAISELATYINK